MQEDTYKKIKKSLRFEKGGEEVYVEIGTKNVPPRIKTKTVIDFLKTLFEETIDQLEAPMMPDEGPSAEAPRRSSAGDIKEADIGQEKFEKLMQEWIQKNHRISFVTDAALDKEQAKRSGQDGKLVSALRGIKDILERMRGTSSETVLGSGMVVDLTPTYIPRIVRKDIQTCCRLSQEEFDKMMQEYEKRKSRKTYVGGAPGPEISIPCPPKQPKT